MVTASQPAGPAPEYPSLGVAYLVVCAAGPAPSARRLASSAVAAGWDVCVIPTPTGLGFVDADELSTITRRPVRAHWRRPGEPGSLPPADGVIVAPATYNTINKWAAGVADTYALSQLAESVGRGVPVVVLPFVNRALAANSVYDRSVRALRADGVLVLDGSPDAEGIRRGVPPHEPGGGDALLESFPWQDALEALSRQLDTRSPLPGSDASG